MPHPLSSCVMLLLLLCAIMASCGNSDTGSVPVLKDAGKNTSMEGQLDMPATTQPDMGISDPADMSGTDITSKDMRQTGMTPDAGQLADMSSETPSPCQRPGVLHVAPKPTGLGDGSSVPNAAGLEQVNDLITQVGPGGTICLVPGVYPPKTTLRKGGAPGRPVTLRGASDEVVFRHTFEAKAANKFGDSALTIAASHLVIDSIRCERVGQCIKFPGDDGLIIEDVTLRDLRIEKVGTGIDITRKGNHAVRRLTIQGVMILQFTRGGIFLGGKAKGITIASSYLDMQPQAIGGQGSDFPVGIALYGDTSEVRIRDTTVLNVLGKDSGYTQGDGMDAENSVRDILVTGSFFAGHRDGCIDVKARVMTIEDTVTLGCKRNFRLWQNDEGDGPSCLRCTSYQPRDAHIFTKGATPAYFKDLMVYSDNESKLVTLDGPGEVVIDGLGGTMLNESKANAKAIKASTLSYGQPVMSPQAPNPTRFTP